MTKDSPKRAILAVLLTALLCSSFVSAAVVLLRPIQLNNQMLERSRNIIALTGLVETGATVEDGDMLELYKSLDRRIVDIDRGVFDDSIDADSFDKRRAARDPDLGAAIPPDLDEASLGRRSRFAPVYLVWREGELDRLILPVRGAGMWSMLYGFIALESDLNTIAGMTFYEQNETPGLGDQITHEHWLDGWRGRRVFDAEGALRFRVSEGDVEAGSPLAEHEVDALTGATVTGNAVTGLVRYWFGPNGYRTFLDTLREQDPEEWR